MEVERYIPYVIKLARRYEEAGLRAGHELRDLIGAGNLGLCTAANRYDPARGTSFLTYAHPYILGAILRQLRDSNGLINASQLAWDRRQHPPTVLSLIDRHGTLTTINPADVAILRVDLRRAMTRLTKLERLALLLTAVYRLTAIDAARRLRVSAPSVYRAIERARVKLRWELSDGFGARMSTARAGSARHGL